MPATGVFAPDRMLVAVRAIAPVAGSPPTSGDITFATPCAISSTLGLWRSPDIRSATTADNSDSIAPSIATVIAGESRVRIRSGRNWGRRICGRPGRNPAEIGLDCLDTGSPSLQAIAVAAPRTQDSGRDSRVKLSNQDYSEERDGCDCGRRRVKRVPVRNDRLPFAEETRPALLRSGGQKSP